MVNDYFSQIPDDYAKYRPNYPPALFNYLANLTKSHNLAWDCGTGNGQAALPLADYFEQVIATDISEAQIKTAIPKTNIHYQVMSAEKTKFANESIDLITGAQALHWFQLEKFYHEVQRVLKPNGVLAAWCYFLLNTNNEILNNFVVKIYHDITFPYWPVERQYIDNEYKTILFPYPRLLTPQFYIEKNWYFKEFIGYLNTWSGLRIYNKQLNIDLLANLHNELQRAWGNLQEPQTMRWPIHLLVGKKASFFV